MPESVKRRGSSGPTTGATERSVVSPCSMAMAAGYSGHPRGRRSAYSAPRAGDGEAQRIRTVAVGTDGSGTASRAVDVALDLAARYEARIVFISAYVPVDAIASIVRRGRPGGHPVDDRPAEDVEATLRDARSVRRSAG